MMGMAKPLYNFEPVMTELTPRMGIIVSILAVTPTYLLACLAASIVLAIAGMA